LCQPNPHDWYVAADLQQMERIEDLNERPRVGDAIIDAYVEHDAELYEGDNDQDSSKFMDTSWTLL